MEQLGIVRPDGIAHGWAGCKTCAPSLHPLKTNKEAEVAHGVEYVEVSEHGTEHRIDHAKAFSCEVRTGVQHGLKLLETHGVRVEEMETSYFLSRDIVIPSLRAGMAMWREKLFASMHHNASAAADFLSLPTNRVVELGSKVEI